MTQTITKSLQQTFMDELKKGGPDWDNLLEIGTNAVYNELLVHNISGDLDRLWDISNKAFKSAVNAWVSGQNEFIMTKSPEEIANTESADQLSSGGPKDTLSEEYVREFQYKLPQTDVEDTDDLKGEEETFEYILTQTDINNNPSFANEGLKPGDVVGLPKNPDFQLDGVIDGQTLTAQDLEKNPVLVEMEYKEGDTYTEQKNIDELLAEKDKSKNKKKKA